MQQRLMLRAGVRRCRRRGDRLNALARARQQTPTIADAILDRLVHNAHRLNLKGESIRKTAVKRSQNQLGI